MSAENSHFGSLAIHAGQEPEQWNSLAVVPPISLSTTFKFSTPRPGIPVGIEPTFFSLQN